MEQENRVVVLIDMDCFYCQVEEKLNPELKGKPIAVVQYNPWKGGGIIAVNYVARAMGVTRHMRGDEAKEKCPEIQLPSVPCLRGKADITKYRDAGKEVARVLQKFTPLLERASIDEAYLDITKPVQDRLKSLSIDMVSTELLPNTYALGYDDVHEFIADVQSYGGECMEFDHQNAQQLLVGAVIVSEIRAAVYNETGYRCSAGIAHNKILAKLVCGMNKPNKQTILPKHSINILYSTLPLKKVKHLGGKFGDTVCEVLKINKMAELQTFTEKELQAKFDEKNGTWLYNIARGIDLEPVQARFNPKSIGCCKQLRGKSALTDLDSLKKWLRDLGDEIEDRLEKDALENNRTPKQMVVSFTSQLPDGRDTSSSRSYNFAADDELCGELFSSKALQLVMDSLEGVRLKDEEPNRKLRGSIKFLGISVGKFEDNTDIKKVKRIVDYFGAGSSKDMMNSAKTNIDTIDTDTVLEEKSNKNKSGKEFILQKFLQTSNKIQENKTNESVPIQSNVDNLKQKPVLETTLANQESFFAKFLNRGLNKENKIPDSVGPVDVNNKTETTLPTTPTCEIVNCGENSNDSDYSGSTINNEINKSIALFEEDPEDISRVMNIRQLLNSSSVKLEQDEQQTENNKTETTPKDTEIVEPMEHFDCSECGKTLTIDMFETHSDYHLALRLRDEDRKQVRNEIKDKSRKSNVDSAKKKTLIGDQCNKNESISSIASFFMKIDGTVPTEMCSECGKRVTVDKFNEHLDFHEAQKLSRELNKKSTIVNFTSSSVKRKKSPGSPIKKTKVPCKSIDSFFR